MRNDRPMTMNDRVALARHKRINAGDVWPGDRPDFDGSVRYVDAAPEYVGSRARVSDGMNVGNPGGPVQQLDRRPITIPSDRPVTIRLVDIKICDSHP